VDSPIAPAALKFGTASSLRRRRAPTKQKNDDLLTWQGTKFQPCWSTAASEQILNFSSPLPIAVAANSQVFHRWYGHSSASCG